MAQQLSSNITQPAGSAYADQLLRRYLPKIGALKFHLSDDENRSYALDALFKTVRSYCSDDVVAEEFWDQVARGAPYDHILMLPNTENARKYQTTCGELTIMLNRRDVKLTCGKVFVNVVRYDKRRERRYLPFESASLNGFRRRKSAGRPAYEIDSLDTKDSQSIDNVLDAFAEIRHQHDVEFVQYVTNIALKRMKNKKHVQVMKALFKGDLRVEVASRFGMKVGNVGAINTKFMCIFREVLEEVSRPRQG
jgi:hypothetical protein